MELTHTDMSGADPGEGCRAQTIIKHVNVSYHTYDRTNDASSLVDPPLKKILDPPLYVTLGNYMINNNKGRTI